MGRREVEEESVESAVLDMFIRCFVDVAPVENMIRGIGLLRRHLVALHEIYLAYWLQGVFESIYLDFRLDWGGLAWHGMARLEIL